MCPLRLKIAKAFYDENISIFLRKFFTEVIKIVVYINIFIFFLIDVNSTKNRTLILYSVTMVLGKQDREWKERNKVIN